MTNSLVQRYRKARSACALFHLENWGIISLTGPDASDFLQRLGTQDVRTLTPGAAVQTLFLKGDGRVVADSAVICIAAKHFLLLTPSACHTALSELLDRYHFAEDVTISDESARFYAAMITGPHRRETGDSVTKACGEAATGCISADVIFAPESHRRILLIPAEQFVALRTHIYETVESGGGIIGSEDLFETLRIEEGVPRYGVDVSDKTIPLEAGQKPAISFTKGCFPGQEIVARINNLGHPANVLVGVTLPEATEDFAGRELLLDGKTVGRITSTAYSPGISGMLGLGYVKWNQREPGTVLTISGGAQYKAAVTVVPLPGLELS